MTGLLVSKNLARPRDRARARTARLGRGRLAQLDAIAAQLEAWWGPEGWQTTVRALDVRPGGLWHFGMGPIGSPPDVWVRSIYTEVIAGSALSYVEGFSDESGADLDPESQAVTVEFIGVDPDRTRLVMRTRFTSVDRLERIIAMGVVEGWTGAFDRLDHLLRSTS